MTDVPDSPEPTTPEAEPTIADGEPAVAESGVLAPEAALAEPELLSGETSGPELHDPDPPADRTGASGDAPSVGPRIIGIAEEKPLPIVKQKLVEKPRREPLPWPELRAYVATIRGDVETGELKELYRALPADVREEVTGNVRGFQKGARRPLSQYAAKQLARAAHTARRQRKGAQPSAEIGEALGLAMTAELIASLEPERAAEVVLPRRDLLDREARSTRRRQKQDEERRRDEDRRRRRENARDASRQTSFGESAGPRIKGLDVIAAQLFGESTVPEPPEQPEATVEPPADAG